MLDDGSEPEFGGWSPALAARIGGWRDDAFWARDPADEVGHPPDELEGDHHDALSRTWRAHLDETIPETSVPLLLRPGLVVFLGLGG